MNEDDIEDEVVLTSKNGNFELVEYHFDNGHVRYFVEETNEKVTGQYVNISLRRNPSTKKYGLLVMTVGRDCNYDEAYEFAAYLIEAADFINELKDIVELE